MQIHRPIKITCSRVKVMEGNNIFTPIEKKDYCVNSIHFSWGNTFILPDRIHVSLCSDIA